LLQVDFLFPHNYVLIFCYQTHGIYISLVKKFSKWN